MYCPKCGSQNVENVQFCRSCGSNLGLVSQALEGKLPEQAPSSVDEELRRKDIESIIPNIFTGLAFLVIAIYFWHGFGIWMLIPAAAMLSKGISRMVSFKFNRN